MDAARRLISATPEAAARTAALDIGFDTPRLGTKVIDADAVSFGYQPAGDAVLVDVTMRLGARERLGVVGANGSGKSTLLEVLAGRRTPTVGQVEHGPTVRVGYYAQYGPELDPGARVRDLVAGPTRAPGDPADLRLMARFWFTGELPWATAGTLSGGERRRLQLLMVLAGRPNVLLIDEPTNDLDLDSLRALEDFLEEWPGALVTVSHDRTFLARVTDRVVACVDRRVREVPGGLAEWIAASIAGEDRHPAGLADVADGQAAAGPAECRPPGRGPATVADQHRVRAASTRQRTRAPDPGARPPGGSIRDIRRPPRPRPHRCRPHRGPGPTQRCRGAVAGSGRGSRNSPLTDRHRVTGRPRFGPPSAADDTLAVATDGVDDFLGVHAIGDSREEGFADLATTIDDRGHVFEESDRGWHHAFARRRIERVCGWHGHLAEGLALLGGLHHAAGDHGRALRAIHLNPIAGRH